MARLTSVRPALGASVARPVLADLREEQTRDQRRRADSPWRAWYNTARWQALRQVVIRRDRWTCQQTGALCVGRANAANAPVVDHIVPHRGDPALFWDLRNLQLVAKSWHDTVKQAQERAGL